MNLEADELRIGLVGRTSARSRPGVLARSRHDSWRQRIEQCLRLHQNGRIEALSEPAVGWGEEIAGRIAFALLVSEPGKTDRGAQLPELRTLLLRNADSLTKASLRTTAVSTATQQVSPDPVQLGLGPPLLSLRHEPLSLGEMA